MTPEEKAAKIAELTQQFAQQIKAQYTSTKGKTVATSSFARRFREGRVLTHSTSPGSFTVLIVSTAPGEWWTVDEAGSILRRSTRWLANNYTNITYMGNAKNLPWKSGAHSNAVTNLALNYPPLNKTAIGKRIVAALHTPASAVQLSTATVTTPKPGSPSLPEVLESGSDTIIFDELTDQAKANRVVTKNFAAPNKPENPYWYESKDDEALYRDFISLHEKGHTLNLLIAGPSGSGKTVGVQQLANALGIPCHIVNCQAITTPEKWIGQMHADMKDGTKFIPSQHIEWVERTHADCHGAERCIILYDEITRLRPELNNMTYSLFDTQRGLEVPQMGRRVIMAPQNIIIATANLGAAFTGTHTQDRAFRERFALTMERDFPPKDEEVKIIRSATSDAVTERDAKVMVSIADHSRTLWRTNEVDSPISTRTLVAWSMLVAGGYSIKKAAQYSVLPMYSDDGAASSERAKITASIESKSKV